MSVMPSFPSGIHKMLTLHSSLGLAPATLLTSLVRSHVHHLLSAELYSAIDNDAVSIVDNFDPAFGLAR